MTIKVLDLFCGRGGWSKGFAELGCECTGIDNRKLGYPFRFIKKDVMDWEPDQWYDIVVASPPCSQWCLPMRNCQGTGVENIGLDLVYRAFTIISQIKPTFYLVENTRQLAEFLPGHIEVVRYGKHKFQNKEAYLWGNFPKLGMFPQQIDFKIDWNNDYKPKRAEIPLVLAREVAKVMVSQIQK